jgi:ABC-type phosphate transport system substrate-binding protein
MKQEDHAAYVSKELAKKYNKELHEKAKTHPRYESLRSVVGKKQAMDTVLNDINIGNSERSMK